MVLDPERYRPRFDAPGHAVYLNHAAVGPCPKATREAVDGWMAELAAHGFGVAGTWGPRLEATRARVARLLGVSPHEIAFVSSTSHGLSLVAQGLHWSSGDEVVVASTIEYPSNVYIWKQLASRGVRVVDVEPEDGGVTRAGVERAMSDRTRLVAVSTVQFASGVATDIGALHGLCRERDVLLCVDGIQSIGAFPLDVEASGIDFLSAASHKWMLGMPGIGILYVRRSRLPAVEPVIVGWRTTREPFAFDGSRYEPREDAAKLEEGSLAFPLIEGLDRSIELLEEAGVAAVAEHITSLLDRLDAGLAALGCKVSPERDRRRGILVFEPAKGDSDSLFGSLAEQGFVLALRGGRLRVSPHLYNTADEIDRLIGAISQWMLHTEG